MQDQKCSVCGSKENLVPEILTISTELSKYPKSFVEVRLGIQVTSGAFSDANNTDGHVCKDCLIKSIVEPEKIYSYTQEQNEASSQT